MEISVTKPTVIHPINIKSSKILAESEDWILEQADAADVAADLAKEVGNLIVRHKTTGTKREFEA